MPQPHATASAARPASRTENQNATRAPTNLRFDPIGRMKTEAVKAGFYERL